MTHSVTNESTALTTESADVTGGFPFTAIVGAEQLQLALLLNAISPAIGGVLVRGEKGTAKSTAVRALAALLPSVAVIEGCRFSCDPQAPEPMCPDGPHGVHAATGVLRPARLVELPVGASEDRVAGSLDLERALSDGVRAFEPGLLATAHRGILYVDEVNLLADHLVDVLLDASAMGRNHVERDAVSVSHPARFVLIGSMNPEEGELRPQLLDRFGLTVEVAASRDPQIRVEVVRRRLAADHDPAVFAEQWATAERELSERIVAARTQLPAVELGDTALLQIAEVCAAFDVDGMRADIVTARTAIAHAAWHGRHSVTVEDVRVAALLALPHRRRRNPFDEPGIDPGALDDVLSRAQHPDDDPDPSGGQQPPGEGQSEDGSSSKADSERDSTRGEPSPASGNATAGIGRAGKAKLLRGRATGQDVGAPGRRAAARTGRGRTVRALPSGQSSGAVHLPATVIGAIGQQHARGRQGGPLIVHGSDLRRAERHGKEGNLVLFVVDASGSMAARTRMTEVKGAVMSLLTDAYQRRDKVGLIAFRGDGAEVVLPPTTSVSNAARRLETIRTGGRTPLAAGIAAAARVIHAEHLRDGVRRPLVVLITDGRADLDTAVRAGRGLQQYEVIVVDCERGPVLIGRARTLADRLGAQYFALAEVTSEPLTGLVNEWQVA